MKPTSRFWIGVALATGLTLKVACKTGETPKPAVVVVVPKAPPVLPLRPADELRSMLLVRATLLPWPRLVAELDGLGTALGLPIAPGTMIAAEVLKKTGMGPMFAHPDQVARMAVDVPVGMAGIGRGSQGQTGICFAVAFKDDAAAAAALGAVGAEVENRQGASLRKAGDTTLWLSRQGRSLLVAEKYEDLVEGGRLALESQILKVDHPLTISVFPAALARDKGVTLEAAFASVGPLVAAGLAEAQKAVETSKKAKKGDAKITVGMQKSLPVLINAVLQPLLDVQTVTFKLALDSTRGLLIRTELEPKPGSALAARVAIRTPYVFDGGLPIAGSRTGTMTWGSFRNAWPLFAQGVAASGEAGKRLSKAVSDFLALSDLDGSCVVDFSPLPLRTVCATKVAPGTNTKSVLDAYVAVIQAAPGWQSEFVGTDLVKPKIKRSATTVEIDQKIVGADAKQRKLFAAMMGGDFQKIAIQVKDGRLVYTSGPNARALLDTVKTGGEPASLSPVLAAIFGRTKGYDAAMQIDLAQLLIGFFEKAATPEMQPAMAMLNAVPGIRDLEMPVVFALQSGAAQSFEFQIPFSSLANVAKIVRPFVGIMGAPK